MRRNPAFQRDLLAALQRANTLSRGALLDVIASPRSLGLGSFVSPARSAVVFWCASVRPCIVGRREQASASPTPLELTSLSCRTTVLLGNSSPSPQSWAHHPACSYPAGILRPLCLRDEAIWPAALSKHRLWALECLNALCLDGELPAACLPQKLAARLPFVVRALDGSLASTARFLRR